MSQDPVPDPQCTDVMPSPRFRGTAPFALPDARVIGDPTYEGSSRIRSLTPVQANGLEFGLVVLIDESDRRPH